jgi:hypothetical protein
VTAAGIRRHGERLLAAVAYPFTTLTRAALTVLVAAATFCVLVLSTFPAYALDLLAADAGYLDDALVALTVNTYRTVGAVGLALVVWYAALTGVATTATLGRVRAAGGRSAGGLASVLPGLLASGCASCGAGVLGVLGFAGALATLPFHGNLLRLGGVVLLAAYLARLGDPRQCAVGLAGGDG